MIHSRYKSITCILATALTMAVCGCQIPSRTYRSGLLLDTAPVISVTEPPPLPAPKDKPWPEHPESECDENNLLGRPCLAFLEFDDFGEYWQRNANGNTYSAGRPTQLDRIIKLIVEAKRQDPGGRPLILTFIHGWKHNALAGKGSGDDDSNIVGVESALNQIHDKKHLWKGHVVIGIYLAWRGGLISPYWPVSQQFTYWNREATAIRVGNSSMTDALIEISDAAKRTTDCREGDACQGGGKCDVFNKNKEQINLAANEKLCSPLLLFVGHSFGALVLERALSQAEITRMEGEWNVARQERQFSSQNPSENRVPITPLADLTIYVNSAAAATESKQMMDYLASSQFQYKPDGATNMPLFLSITSEADLATSLLLKVGHAVPLLGYKWNGSMRPKSAESEAGGSSTTSYGRACFTPPPDENSKGKSSIRYDLSETDYFMTTTAHKQELWSHNVTQTLVPGRSAALDGAPCERGTGDIYATCKIGSYDYAVSAAENRCNGTPYWAIQVQKELIPDHGTIFTGRLIDFLTAFISFQDPDGKATLRPQLTKPLNLE